MAKQQTRRSISFNRELYEVLHREAAKQQKSATQFVTEIVRNALKKRGVKLPAQYFTGPGRGRANNQGVLAPPFKRNTGFVIVSVPKAPRSP